jgi:hypothetical protein
LLIVIRDGLLFFVGGETLFFGLGVLKDLLDSTQVGIEVGCGLQWLVEDLCQQILLFFTLEFDLGFNIRRFLKFAFGEGFRVEGRGCFLLKFLEFEVFDSFILLHAFEKRHLHDLH